MQLGCRFTVDKPVTIKIGRKDRFQSRKVCCCVVGGRCYGAGGVSLPDGIGVTGTLPEDGVPGSGRLNLQDRPAGKAVRSTIGAALGQDDRRIDTIVELVSVVQVDGELHLAVVFNSRRTESSEQFFSGVNIRYGQGAGHGFCHTAVFCNTAGIHTTDHGGIIGTRDGDGDVMGRAIKRVYRDRISHGGAGGQGLHVRIGIVERVGPVACRIDGYGAIAANRRTRREQFLTGVDVGDCQRAGYGFRHATVFGDIAGIDTADHGGIIGAVDGDGDVVGGAVNGRYGHGVGQCGTGRQCLHIRIGIVEGVCPIAVGVDCCRPVGAHRRPVGEQFLTGVNVRYGQGAGHGFRGAAVFNDAAGVHTADDGGIIGAGDGDSDVVGRAINGADGHHVVHGGTGR